MNSGKTSSRTLSGVARNVYRVFGIKPRDLRIINILEFILAFSVFILSVTSVREYVNRVETPRQDPSAPTPVSIREVALMAPASLSGKIIEKTATGFKLEIGYVFLADARTQFTAPLTGLDDLQVDDYVIITSPTEPCTGRSTLLLTVERTTPPTGTIRVPHPNPCPFTPPPTVIEAQSFIASLWFGLTELQKIFGNVVLLLILIIVTIELLKRFVLERIETLTFNLERTPSDHAFVQLRRLFINGTVHEGFEVHVIHRPTYRWERKGVRHAKIVRNKKTGEIAGCVLGKKWSCQSKSVTGLVSRWQGYNGGADRSLFFIVQNESKSEDGSPKLEFFSVQMKSRFLWFGIRGGDKSPDQMKNKSVTVEGKWSDARGLIKARKITVNTTEEVIKR